MDLDANQKAESEPKLYNLDDLLGGDDDEDEPEVGKTSE